VLHVGVEAKDPRIFSCQRCPNAPDTHEEPQRLRPPRLTLNGGEQ
jgi:hypothetical protein